MSTSPIWDTYVGHLDDAKAAITGSDFESAEDHLALALIERQKIVDGGQGGTNVEVERRTAAMDAVQSLMKKKLARKFGGMQFTKITYVEPTP